MRETATLLDPGFGHSISMKAPLATQSAPVTTGASTAGSKAAPVAANGAPSKALDAGASKAAAAGASAIASVADAAAAAAKEAESNQRLFKRLYASSAPLAVFITSTCEATGGCEGVGIRRSAHSRLLLSGALSCWFYPVQPTLPMTWWSCPSWSSTSACGARTCGARRSGPCWRTQRHKRHGWVGT